MNPQNALAVAAAVTCCALTLPWHTLAETSSERHQAGQTWGQARSHSEDISIMRVTPRSIMLNDELGRVGTLLAHPSPDRLSVAPECSSPTSWPGEEGTWGTLPPWFASSQVHHGYGCRLAEPWKLAKQLACAVIRELVGRDDNASTGSPQLAGECQLWLSWSHGPQAQQSHRHQDRVTGGRPPRPGRLTHGLQGERQGNERPVGPSSRHPARPQLHHQPQVTGRTKLGSCFCAGPKYGML